MSKAKHSWMVRGIRSAAWSVQRMRTALRVAEDVCDGLCAHVLRPQELEALTLACYATRRQSEPASETLFEWERRLFERVLPANSRVLLLGAGAGRELLGLGLLGHQVWALEPVAEACRRARTKASAPERLAEAGFREFVRDGLELWSERPPASFDAAILGWGALTHCFGDQLRAQLFASLAALCPTGPILASFWAASEPATTLPRGHRWVRSLADRWPRESSANEEESLATRFRAHAGVGLLFSDDELQRLAVAAGRRVTERYSVPYPHVVMLP